MWDKWHLHLLLYYDPRQFSSPPFCLNCKGPRCSPRLLRGF
jgi:hypothetical protein